MLNLGRDRDGTVSGRGDHLHHVAAGDNPDRAAIGGREGNESGVLERHVSAIALGIARTPDRFGGVGARNVPEGHADRSDKSPVAAEPAVSEVTP